MFPSIQSQIWNALQKRETLQLKSYQEGCRHFLFYKRQMWCTARFGTICTIVQKPWHPCQTFSKFDAILYTAHSKLLLVLHKVPRLEKFRSTHSAKAKKAIKRMREGGALSKIWKREGGKQYWGSSFLCQLPPFSINV